MRPANTWAGRSSGRAGLSRRLLWLVAAGAGPPPDPAALASVLLPVVGRAVRTGRGPAALVGWLRRRGGLPPGAAAGATTEELVRLVLAADRPADTRPAHDTVPACPPAGAGYRR